MRYNLTTPCKECPYLKGSGFAFASLVRHASGEFACHKQCDLQEDPDGGQEVFVEKPGNRSNHCAGALIFLEKQNRPHQMMRIAERLGLYDRTKLDMSAPVVSAPADCRRKS